MLLNIILSTLGYFAINKIYNAKFNDNKLNDKLNANNNLNIINLDLLVSTIHAILTINVSFLYFTDFINEETYINLIPITIGYAIYDTWFINNNKINNRGLLSVHHFIIVYVNYWLVIHRDYYVLNIVSLHYLTEISTLFLNLSTFLYKNKLTNIKIYNLKLFDISNYSLITTFFIFRIAIGTYVIYITAFYNILFYIQALMTSLNYYWFYKILKRGKII